MANMLDKLLDWLLGRKHEELMAQAARRAAIRYDMEADWDKQGRRWNRQGHEVKG